MWVAVAALIFFLFIALLSGTITKPTTDDILLLVSSAGLLLFSYVRMKERRAEKKAPDKSVENKQQRRPTPE
jgi:hypothetical protein